MSAVSHCNGTHCSEYKHTMCQKREKQDQDLQNPAAEGKLKVQDSQHPVMKQLSSKIQMIPRQK